MRTPTVTITCDLCGYGGAFSVRGAVRSLDVREAAGRVDAVAAGDRRGAEHEVRPRTHPLGDSLMPRLCAARLGVSAGHTTTCVLDPDHPGEHDNGVGIRWGAGGVTVHVDVHLPDDPLDNW